MIGNVRRIRTEPGEPDVVGVSVWDGRELFVPREERRAPNIPAPPADAELLAASIRAHLARRGRLSTAQLAAAVGAPQTARFRRILRSLIDAGEVTSAWRGAHRYLWLTERR